MKIHEYQGKEILKKYGVPVLRGIPAFSVEDALKAAQALGGSVWVVKAQIHAGGRGKGGGVKVAKSMDEVKHYAEQILGMQLVTHQTGPAGQKVRRLLIEEGANIQKEYYLGMVIDRATQKTCVMASSEGGMDIEHVAEHTPELIHKLYVDPVTGITDEQADDLARKMGMPEGSVAGARSVLQGLYQAFVETDADLAEINPLITTADGKVVALDAKMNFDSNALYRHPEIVEMRDLDVEDAAEIEASKHGLSYISLDGNIGCLVNGAGLAMATMDTIKLYGGEPANFLDVGGGATTEKVTEAFKLMLKNPNLKAILVNIFGGIMKCDVIAEGVVSAAKQVHLKVPLVVRMKGTNEELGKKILADSGLPIISADTMAQAAERVVAAAQEHATADENGLGGKVAAAAGVAGVAGLAATVGDKVGHVTEGVVDVVKNTASGVADMAGEVADAVGDIADSSVSAAKSVVSGAVDLAGGAVETVGDIASGSVDVVKSAATGVADLAGEAVEAVGDIASGSVEAVKDVVAGTDKLVGGAVASATAAGATALGVSAQGAEKSASWVKRYWWLLPLALLLGWLLTQCGGQKPAAAPPAAQTGQATQAAPATPAAPAAPAKVHSLDAAVVELFKTKGANIAFVGNKLTLTGEVADQATKDELLAKAKAVLASLGTSVTLDDQMLVKGAKASAGAVLLKVNFATGSSVIPAADKAGLNEFAAGAKKAALKGEISGHTDNTGNAAANVALSDARAKAVVAYLIKQGIAADALTAKGYGADKPIANNGTEDGRARNRRVEFMPAK